MEMNNGKQDTHIEIISECSSEQPDTQEEEQAHLTEGGKKRLPKGKAFLKDNLMVLLIFAGVLVGLAFGFGLRHLHPSTDALMWIGMPGEIFLRLLKLVIVPLIVCSVITVTASLDSKTSEKAGMTSLAYIIITNITGCVTGLVFSVIILSGDDDVLTDGGTKKVATMQVQDIFADLLRNIFPDNMVEATFSKTRTAYKETDVPLSVNGTNVTMTTHLSKSVSQARGINLVGLVVLSAMLGLAANKSGADSFVRFFAEATNVVMKLTRGLFWLAPLGLACMTSVAVARVPSIASTFARLGNLVLSSTLGLAFLQLIVLPLVLLVVTRSNPARFLLRLARPYLVAFATTSTAAAMPDMLNACDTLRVIDRRVSRGVIPLAVALAKGGSAVYIASAVLFVAQTHHSLGASDIVLVGVLVSLGVMAIPAVPSSSLVTVVIILTSLNLPSDDVALLFAVEWIMDRLRTACNVVCQTSCAAVTTRFCRDALKAADARPSLTMEARDVTSPHDVMDTKTVL